MDVELYLDNFFKERGFCIEKTTAKQERTEGLGDRIFSKDNQSYFVEYKSGIQTFYTGNIFLETISVDSCNKPGWVYTCKANYIFYAVLLNRKILIFEPEKLRSEIDNLKTMFKEAKTSKQQNNGYDTYGVLVPLNYAEQYLASKVIKL